MGYRASFMLEKLLAEMNFVRSRTDSLLDLMKEASKKISIATFASREEAAITCTVVALEFERLNKLAEDIAKRLREEYTQAIEESI